MEPVTIALVSTIGLIATSTGVLAGRWWGRRTSPTAELLDRIQELEDAKIRLERDLGYEERWRKAAEERNEVLEQQRDKYRRMAESHEIKMPEPPEIEVGTVWEKRKFNGHPKDNLRNLRNEMKEHLKRDITLHIKLRGGDLGGGGYGRIIAKAWTNDGKPVKDIGPWEFHGPGDRALKDLETFLMDDDTGLVDVKKVNGRRKKTWKDEDSPLVFEVTLEVEGTNKAPEIPKPQIVEVPVVQVEREIVTIEKLVESPEADTPAGIIPEEIRSLVADELARRAAAEEVEALDKTVEDARERLKRDRAAAKQRA